MPVKVTVASCFVYKFIRFTVNGPRRKKPGLREFPTKRDSNQSPQLQRLAKIKISLVASLDMILSNKRIAKALIRLRGCAGWSAHVLFANPEDRFSRVQAQIMITTVL